MKIYGGDFSYNLTKFRIEPESLTYYFSVLVTKMIELVDGCWRQSKWLKK